MPSWRKYFRLYQHPLSHHLRQAQTTRWQWRLLKQFPQCFADVRSDDMLTETQWTWLQCQYLLDDGVALCSACDSLGVGAYCPACGQAMHPASRVCDQCHLPGTGAYCQHCGAVLQSAVAEAIDAGSFDWDAWARSLTPFLKGLTPQEESLVRTSHG